MCACHFGYSSPSLVFLSLSMSSFVSSCWRSLDALVSPRSSSLASSFTFDPSSTFLASPVYPVSFVSLYLVIILVLRLVIGGPVTGKKVRLYGLDTLHSTILCVWSAMMVVGVVRASLARLDETAPSREAAHKHVRALSSFDPTNGWLAANADLFCFPPSVQAKGPLFFVSYSYYISKLYELIDTVILVVKRKPLTFLHVGHHACVVLMSYLWLTERQSLQAIALATNATIHVFMYFYYAATSLGGVFAKLAVPFKVFITKGQIVQFVFSFVASIPFVVWTFADVGNVAAPSDEPRRLLSALLYPGSLIRASVGGGSACRGFDAWLFNAAFNAALLVLFVNFHKRTYGGKKEKKQ